MSDIDELARKATQGPWDTGCFVDPESKCQCKYILSEGYAGSIATISVDNGKRIGDGGNDSPKIDEARANAAYIAAANPAAWLERSARITELEATLKEARENQETLMVAVAILKVNSKWLMKAAEEIRAEGHAGWGNTCEQAAEAIMAAIEHPNGDGLKEVQRNVFEEAARQVETMPAKSIGIPKGGWQPEAFDMVEHTLKELAKRIRALASTLEETK